MDDLYRENERLRTENANLAQALSQKDGELQAAKQATCNLAAWALKERERLTTQALQQRLQREDYEVLLRERDEQIAQLLKTHHQVRLDHARTLVREGEAIGFPLSDESIQKICEMRRYFGMPPIDRRGVLQRVASDLQERTQQNNPLRELRENSNLEEGVARYDGADAGLGSRWSGAIAGVFSASSLPEGKITDVSVGSYSPPVFQDGVPIASQVDEMIKEEMARLAAGYIEAIKEMGY
ncbi:hypothetical protein OPT61_g5906 [Boeremia exigua]|uniref:Uncharacterized protein n=1 Tax=Boeremia exigua TaxID=749465 RepID=A0ACC2I8K0_9PLEO|nr:hypothetical protein OPT61_g5906 [Boeremia exigua]